MKIDPAALFAEPLVDLGETDARLRGILAPQSERGVVKVGVTAQFLDNAADYHETYRNIEYFRILIDRALARFAAPPQPRIILDIGSGSGNSVIPLLDRFPDAFVVATDISTQLLAILRDHLEAHARYRDRYALVCMDASNDHYRAERFDLAVGAAILHHIIEPGRVLSACASALRPGGSALFFEPFELGHALLKLAYTDIIAESNRRSESAPGIGMLERIVEDLTVRMQDKTDPLFLELDDKWLFTRSFFEAATRSGRWQGLEIHPISSDVSPLTDQTRINLRLGLGTDESALPDWAWERLRRYETAFSRHARRDLLFEGAVILRKDGANGQIAPGARMLGAAKFEPELRLAAGAGSAINGWWWNPAEPGSGFFVAEKNELLTITCCIYGKEGAPEWHTAGPIPMPMGTAWQAADFRRMLPAATAGSRDVPEGREVLRLRMENPGAIQLRWGERQTTLEKQHPNAPHFRTDFWIEDCDIPTIAVAIECLPDSIFAALFTVDGWCITVATPHDHVTYAGEWLRYHGGQTRDGPWKPATSETLGKAHIAWAHPDCVVVRLPTGRHVALARYASR